MDWQKSSQFGDMFGGIGALFSGLALAGVVVAVLMQRDELELQREELVATREELKRSAEAQTASSQALSRQFEVMSISAQLTALDTLYHHHSETAAGYLKALTLVPAGNPSHVSIMLGIQTAEEKKTTVIQRIDTLIQDLEQRSRPDTDPATEEPGDAPAGK